MVEKIKKGDFIEFDFIGSIKASGQVFDLSVEKVAKTLGLHKDGREYKPLEVCVGAGHIIPGLDETLVGREIGKEFELDIPAKKAFGPRDQKLIQLTPLSVFKKRDIHPVPGMQLDLDGQVATVRSVSGGRVIIDFNPPLSGKELHYWVKPLKVINNTTDKAKSVFRTLGFKTEGVKFEKDILMLNLANKDKLGKKFLDILEKEIKKHLPEIKKVTFK